MKITAWLLIILKVVMALLIIIEILLVIHVIIHRNEPAHHVGYVIIAIDPFLFLAALWHIVLARKSMNNRNNSQDFS